MRAADELEVCRAWRALFLADDGTFLPMAETVLRDLEKACGWMVSAPPQDDTGRTDPYRAVAALEKRGIYAHVRRRLFDNLVPLAERAAQQSMGD